MTNATPARTPRRRRVLLWSIVGALLVVLVGSAIWLGVRAAQARDELTALVPLVDDLRVAAADRDLVEIGKVADEVGEHAARAAELTGDPIWRAAEIIPVAGPNLTAVRVVSQQLDQMSDESIPPLLSVLGIVDGASLLDAGKVDLALLGDLRSPLDQAHRSFSFAADELDGLDTADVVAEVRDAVGTLRAAVHIATDATAGASDAVQILPSMLGAEGPRTILLMFQNNAELRTGGGITGSFAQFDAVDGSISLVRQASSSDFERRASPILPIPTADAALFGDEVGTFVQNVTMSTDFEFSAALGVAWWQEYTGVTPDVVVAIDPLVIRSVVAAGDGISLPDGTILTADGFVDELLIEPYRALDQDAQTVLQQMVTAATFDFVLRGGLSPVEWVTALTQPVQDGRVSVWTADEKTNARVADSVLGGPRARHALAPDDAFAVWLNDTSGGKMGPYLQTAVQPQVAVCRADGKSEVAISVTLTSTAPADAAALPFSVTGGGNYGVAAGDLGVNVSVAAPPGFLPGGVTEGAERLLPIDVDDRGFATSLVSVVLAPGQTRTVDFMFVSPNTDPVVPTILHTPLIEDPEIGPPTARPCG